MDNYSPEQLTEEFLKLPSEEQRKRLLLVPDYGSAYQDVVKPNQATLIPNYFFEKWARVLGPLPVALYLQLRRRCYYDFSRKQADKDIAFPSQETLCKELGLGSRMTLRKALKSLEEHGLIKRKATFRNQPGTGHVLRTSDRITVFFDVPLVSEDLGAFMVRGAERMVAQSTEEQLANPKKKKTDHRMDKMWPIGEGAVDNPDRMNKEWPHGAGQNMARKTYLEDLESNVNVGLDPSKETGTATAVSQVRAFRELEGNELFEAERSLDTIKGFVTDFSKSQRFYERVAANLPADRIRTVISDLEALERSGEFSGWKKSRNAALVSEFMRTAEQCGIELRSRRGR